MKLGEYGWVQTHANGFYVNPVKVKILETDGTHARGAIRPIIDQLNSIRYLMMQEEDEEERARLWRSAICLLPESYLQTRIVKCSYEALHNMYQARKDHKLSEWRMFCEELRKLPYFEFVTN